MGGDPSDFDVTRLNLGGFQHALDDLTPQAANSQAITQPKRPSFSVPVLERGNVAPGQRSKRRHMPGTSRHQEVRNNGAG